MSDRRYGLEIAENAQRDILEIRLYSTEVWGIEQADNYLARLSASFETLCSNSMLGKSRDDLRPGLRQLVIGEHRVLYRLTDDMVWVLRVAHTKMDVTTISVT
jgi:toxin ParE1/3/4